MCITATLAVPLHFEQHEFPQVSDAKWMHVNGTQKQVRKTAACDTHLGFLKIPVKLALVSEVFRDQANQFRCEHRRSTTIPKK